MLKLRNNPFYLESTSSREWKFELISNNEEGAFSPVDYIMVVEVLLQVPSVSNWCNHRYPIIVQRPALSNDHKK